MKSNKILAVIVVLQGLILIGQWTSNGYLTSAQAQVPDPANRQMQMIDEMKETNGKLDKLISILESGDLQVKVAKADDEKGSAPARK